MPSITRRHLVAAPAILRSARAAASRPNVVMFMTDDHGFWATGDYGCTSIQTPNIDALAKSGARFTRAFACTPVCSPSRMTYMTGKIPSTHGVYDWLRPVDSFGPTTRRWLDGHTPYSSILAANGYTGGMTGKWHMGDDDKSQFGFSFWASVPGGGGTYRDPEFVKNGRRIKTGGYKTDLVTDYALEFLDQQSSANPFYLLVPFYAPHTPYDYQPEPYRRPYLDSTFPCFPDTPPHAWQNRGLRAHHGNPKSKLAYSALITGVDHNIGRVLRRLEERGLRDNTLVIFTADQGWNAGHHGVWGKGNGTWPFNMYEESIRVPMVWNHPARIRPGQIIPHMISSYDYFPTILDYLGVTAPPDPKRVGRSYLPLLEGRQPRPRGELFFEYAHARAVRTETLKYIERTKEFPSELFDLEADPGETRNVIDDPAYRKRREALRSTLHRFFEKTGAPPLEDWRSHARQQLPDLGN